MLTSRLAVVLTLAMMVLPIAISDSAAAPGDVITYQGELSDAGAPASGIYDFQVRLWSALAGGVQAGSTIALDDVAVANGLFSVQLDFGAGVFSVPDRWLEIAVRPGSGSGADPYTTLAPRQPVTAAPFALQTRGMYVDGGGHVSVAVTDAQGARFRVFDDGSSSEGTALFTSTKGPLWTHIHHGGNGDILLRSASTVGRVAIQDFGGVTSVGVGDTESSRFRVHDSAGMSNGTALFTSAKGPNWSHIHEGSAGNIVLRSAQSAGRVILQDTGGNVGVGTGDARARLSVNGPVVRAVTAAGGNGPHDDTDVGQIVSRVLGFTKLYDDTALRITYTDNFRVIAPPLAIAAKRWEIRIDGNPAAGGGIHQDIHVNSGTNHHRPATIVAFAESLVAGPREIQVWVDDTPGFSGGDAYTGWDDSRWTIEAEEVWLQ